MVEISWRHQRLIAALSSLSLQLLLLALWGLPFSSARARDRTEYCSSEESYVNLVWLHHANRLLKHFITSPPKLTVNPPDSKALKICWGYCWRSARWFGAILSYVSLSKAAKRGAMFFKLDKRNFQLPFSSARARGRTEYCSSEESYVDLVWLHHANRLLKHFITCLASFSFCVLLFQLDLTFDIVRSLCHLTGACAELGGCSMWYFTYCWTAFVPIWRKVSISLACSGVAFWPLNALNSPRFSGALRRD